MSFLSLPKKERGKRLSAEGIFPPAPFSLFPLPLSVLIFWLAQCAGRVPSLCVFLALWERESRESLRRSMEIVIWELIWLCMLHWTFHHARPFIRLRRVSAKLGFKVLENWTQIWPGNGIDSLLFLVGGMFFVPQFSPRIYSILWVHYVLLLK